MQKPTYRSMRLQHDLHPPCSCRQAVAPLQTHLSTPDTRAHCFTMQIAHATKSHKSLQRAGIGQRLVREVLCIELEKDGSDTWRLEPVIELLKQGGVSLMRGGGGVQVGVGRGGKGRSWSDSDQRG